MLSDNQKASPTVMQLCLAALLLLSFFFVFAAAGTHTCDVAREGGTIDLAYFMLRSTHPMSHSAKQVNSFAGESPKTAAAGLHKKGYHRPRHRAGG